MVLDGCGDEAEEECWDGSNTNGGAAACAAAGEKPMIMFPVRVQSRVRRARRVEERRRKLEVIGEDGAESEEEDQNGGAAACAAASERPEGQRLPVMAAFGRRRPVRMAPVVRSGAADSGESSEESEDADMNGGAAACAAASRIEAIGDELQGLQERMADLLMERRELQRSLSEGADEQEAEDSGNDEQDDCSDAEDSVSEGDEQGDGSVSAVRWMEDSDGKLEDCSDRMVTVTNIPVPVDELRIGRALSCGQDGRVGTMWSDQDGNQEEGECTGRVWLHFEEPAYAEEAVQEWHGALYEGKPTVVRMGYWLAAGSDGLLEEETLGGSCSDVEEDSDSSQTEEEI